MKLLSLIESTKLKVSEDQSYDDLRVAKYLCRLDNKKFSGYGRISKYISRAEDLRNDENDKYKSILRQPSPSSDDSWASANLNLKEGEERSIIQDACIEKLVDEFGGRENQFANKEDFEYAIYQALEDLDVEDCVDPDMEVGGQRIGDFASGRVIDCCSSSSIIYDVMANMDETQIGEGIFTKHSDDPVAPGGQSSKRKNLHATGDIVTLNRKKYKVTKVDLNKGEINVVDLESGQGISDVKAGVFSPGTKVGDRKSSTIGNFPSDNRDPRLFDGKSPFSPLQQAYDKVYQLTDKMGDEALEQMNRYAPKFSDAMDKYDDISDIEKNEPENVDLYIKELDYVLSQISEGKSPHKKGSAKYKKHMAAMHAEAKDPIKSDADQIIQQIIQGYGIDNLEDVFRQYYPQLSDEQVERFLSKHKKPELRLIKNEDADINDNMIGQPDDYYDAEQRQEAHKDLQNALQGNYMDDYIIDGSCPACGGSGYIDGEDEVYNDETEEYEEGSECDGFGNFGCDEGEMTYGSDGPSWVEIIKHDKRQADRRDAVANYPGDEKVISQIANMVKGMEDPRMAMQQMAVDYPQMGRRQRAELVSKGMKKAGLTNEGQRCWKGYEKKGTKKMFGKTVNNCVKKESIEMNEVKMVKTRVGPMPVNADGSALSYKDYEAWELETSNDTPKKNIISQRYDLYIQDIKQYVRTESIQAGDELMIETSDGEGIVVPVLHVVDESILVGWDELAEDIVVEGARQLEELRKLAGIEITEDKGYTYDLDGPDLVITSPKGKTKVIKNFTYFDEKPSQAELKSFFKTGKSQRDESIDEITEDKNCGCGQDPCKTYGKIKEAEYQGRKVKLGKPTRGDVKKFKVYVKDPKTGNVKKVNFGHGGTSAKKAGQKTMKIKKSNPARRKSFRARHNCDNPGPRTKARYWSCRAW